MTPGRWIAAATVLAMLVGLALVVGGRRLQRRLGPERPRANLNISALLGRRRAAISNHT
jgi:membrane protein implicated in regulation of membrane protease activity